MMVAMLEYNKSPAAFMMFLFHLFCLSKMNFTSCLGDFKGMNCPSFIVGIRVCQQGIQ